MIILYNFIRKNFNNEMMEMFLQLMFCFTQKPKKSYSKIKRTYVSIFNLCNPFLQSIKMKQFYTIKVSRPKKYIRNINRR